MNTTDWLVEITSVFDFLTNRYLSVPNEFLCSSLLSIPVQFLLLLYSPN